MRAVTVLTVVAEVESVVSGAPNSAGTTAANSSVFSPDVDP